MRKFTSVEQIDTVISFERVLTPPAECGALAASVPVRAPRSLCSENLVRKLIINERLVPFPLCGGEHSPQARLSENRARKVAVN